VDDGEEEQRLLATTSSKFAARLLCR
jgi:hypothetical protein